MLIHLSHILINHLLMCSPTPYSVLFPYIQLDDHYKAEVQLDFFLA